MEKAQNFDLLTCKNYEFHQSMHGDRLDLGMVEHQQTDEQQKHNTVQNGGQTDPFAGELLRLILVYPVRGERLVVGRRAGRQKWQLLQRTKKGWRRFVGVLNVLIENADQHKKNSIEQKIVRHRLYNVWRAYTVKPDFNEHQREGKKDDEQGERQGGQFEFEMSAAGVERNEEGGERQYDSRIVGQIDQIEVEGGFAFQIDVDLQERRIALFVHHLRLAQTALVDQTVDLAKGERVLSGDVQFGDALEKAAQQQNASLLIFRIQGQINGAFGRNERFWFEQNGAVALNANEGVVIADTNVAEVTCGVDAVPCCFEEFFGLDC